jgi:hypothetical protein
MKTTLFFTIGVVALFAGLSACKDNTCGNQITGVQPNANQANHEVIIHPHGFSQQAKVFFGLQEATTRPGLNGDIVARVPAGLRSDVEISVQENSCIARTSFTVLDSLPGIYGLSLPDIILPYVPNSPPGGIDNEWQNLADSSHTFMLHDSTDSSVGLLSTVTSYEMHTTNSLLGAKKHNPISGPWSNAKPPYIVQISIDRTGNGGALEVYDGQFIKTKFSPAFDSTALVLTSKTSGRQLILVHK